MKNIAAILIVFLLVGCATIYQPFRYEKAHNTIKNFWPQCQILSTNTHYSFLVEDKGGLFFVNFDENGDIYKIDNVKK